MDCYQVFSVKEPVPVQILQVNLNALGPEQLEGMGNIGESLSTNLKVRPYIPRGIQQMIDAGVSQWAAELRKITVNILPYSLNLSEGDIYGIKRPQLSKKRNR